ncbi:acetylornithine transaminase [Corynebacterium marinum]|uniref:Acetylornithine aminotransferase n=2 Tax=Corynebacterium marinum TaxID=349751 RepID=A0A0B6TR77_9CORY|nr:acetylornithine transaminase [Corynebacterium marinum]AJK68774.1 Acetylornithine aminotransferase [Corynebacterium marinum DSM 44953]NLF92174.1 acetylornithine transaminase [Corynebacterium marinum]GGO13554.1 acetylornithine aminotransferase [Corynebacterium marinum]
MTDALTQWNQVLMNNYGTPPIELVSGKGATVQDSQGRVHIDMLAGIAVNALGHAHPAIIEAVSHQLSQLGHVSNLFATRPVVQLAETLKERVGDDSARVFFCNSGGEANEAAFKLARLTGRSRVLAAVDGFHGRTMGSLALTGQPDKRKPFEPLPTGVEFYPYGDIDYLTKLVEVNPTDVAAIFLEPIQGETGVIPAPEGFLRAVRELCDTHGILFVADEVQTGVGRTGDFFAFQHDGVLPDVVTMAKGLGGGIPIGATIARGKAAELFTPGSHGTTFGGNPVACAAANAVLSIVDDAFCGQVARKGEFFAEKLRAIDGVTEVRGRGLMLGVVLEHDVAKQAVARGFDHGLILNAPAGNVIRLTPPLVISDDEMNAAVEKLTELLTELNKENRS